MHVSTRGCSFQKLIFVASSLAMSIYMLAVVESICLEDKTIVEEKHLSLLDSESAL